MSTLAPAANHPRLMIADDDPVVLSMLSASLGGEYDVVGVAGDGEQAIELARLSQPDAAILDVDMPKGGGLGAARGITAVAPETAIVMLSSDETDGVVRQLMQAGATAYRRKGITARVLSQSLSDSIEAHSDVRRVFA